MIRRSKKEWRALFADQEASGLTAAAFCHQHSLSEKYFSIRKRQLGWPKASPAFVAVKPSTPAMPLDAAGQCSLRVVEVTVSADQLPNMLAQCLR